MGPQNAPETFGGQAPPGPAGGAHSAPPDPLAGAGGDTPPVPTPSAPTAPRSSRLRRSDGAFGAISPPNFFSGYGLVLPPSHPNPFIPMTKMTQILEEREKLYKCNEFCNFLLTFIFWWIFKSRLTYPLVKFFRLKKILSYTRV